MTPEEFERQLNRDLKRLRRQASKAVAKTAKKAVQIVQKNTPKAFGELRESIQATDTSTIVTAPHAQAVEVGARPHLVPLEELIKWVKLRGMQGLSKTGKVARSDKQFDGPTTGGHARRVARQLRDMVSEGALSVNAPEQIAKAIQMAILKNGIKPTWFVQKSLPDVVAYLDSEMRKVFK